jgi:hypothetical protein
MENNIENKDDDNINVINGKNEHKNINNNLFINFIEDYYGFFKQFISFEDLYNIGKVNKKLMSLFLIDKGNNLYNKIESKKIQINQIISVSLFYK